MFCTSVPMCFHPSWTISCILDYTKLHLLEIWRRAFLQLEVNPPDRDALRFLLVEPKENPLLVTVVTYRWNRGPGKTAEVETWNVDGKRLNSRVESSLGECAIQPFKSLSLLNKSKRPLRAGSMCPSPACARRHWPENWDDRQL
jgi:hypothetical protein